MNANRILCTLVAALQLNACMSINPVPYTRGLGELPPLRAGDVVTLHTRTDTHHLVVSRLTPELVCGNHECIRIDQIESIKRLGFDAGTTVFNLLLLLVVGGAMGGRNVDPLNGSFSPDHSMGVSK